MLKHTPAEYEATVRNLSWAFLDSIRTRTECPEPSPKLGLAIRRMLISWIQAQKPYCIGEATPKAIQLYGGASLQKDKNGIRLVGLKGSLSGKTMMSDIGVSLVAEAQHAVQSEYNERLNEFMADVFKAWPSANAEGNADLDFEAHLQSHVRWVTEGGMRVAYWGRGMYSSMLTKMLLKKAWDLGILDKEVWGLALRVAGLRAKVEHYNAIARNLEQVRARLAETPNLLPLLWAPTSSDPYTQDYHLRTDQLAISFAREQLMVHGMTPAGWRWLSKQNREWVLRFAESADRPAIAMTVNTLAAHQVGVLPRGIIQMGTLIHWMTENCAVLATRTTHYPKSMALILKATIEAVGKRKVKVSDVKHDIQLIMDFVRAGNPVEKGATLRSLMHRQEAWHRAIHREQIAQFKAHREELPAYEWTPLVSDVEYEKVKAISLTSSDALWDEGDTLEHCVGTYASACYQNESRIFSLRDTKGLTLATLELRQFKGRWSVAQLRGRRNRVIKDKNLLKLADIVLREAKRAPQLNPTANTVVREGVHPHWWQHRAANMPAAGADDGDIPF